MADDNSSAREQLITSFSEFTSSSRRETNLFLVNNDWNLHDAVKDFAKTNDDAIVSAANISNPSDDNKLPGIPIDDFVLYHQTVQNIESPRVFTIPYTLVRRQDEDFHVNSFKRVGRTLGRLDSLTTTPPPSMADPARPTTTDSAVDIVHVVTLWRDGYTVNDGSLHTLDEPENEEFLQEILSGDSSRDFVTHVTLIKRQEEEFHEVEITHSVTLWRNGYTMNDGPFTMSYDPENEPIIKGILSVESPRVIKTRYDLTRRQEEDYPESPRRFIPFESVGRTLGSVSTEPSTSLVLDPAAPATTIQLKLADGTRIVSRFNIHHTVRDIRVFIDESRPDDSIDYQLLVMGSFPPRQLLDPDQTLENADISNCLLTQRY